MVKYMDERPFATKVEGLRKIFDLAADDDGELANYEELSAAVRSDIVEELFPLHINELRYIVSQNFLRINQDLGGIEYVIAFSAPLSARSRRPEPRTCLVQKLILLYNI